MTVKELHDILTEAIIDGNGELPVVIGRERVELEYHATTSYGFELEVET